MLTGAQKASPGFSGAQKGLLKMVGLTGVPLSQSKGVFSKTNVSNGNFFRIIKLFFCKENGIGSRLVFRFLTIWRDVFKFNDCPAHATSYPHSI